MTKQLHEDLLGRGEHRPCGLLPLRNSVLFPLETRAINCGRPRTMRLIDSAVATQETLLVVAAQRAEEVDDPDIGDLWEIGTAARLVKVIPLGPGKCSAVLEGIARVRIQPADGAADFLRVRYARLNPVENGSPDVRVRLVAAAQRALRDRPGMADRLARLDRLDRVGHAADAVGACLEYVADLRFRQGLLENLNAEERASALLQWFEQRGAGTRSPSSG